MSKSFSKLNQIGSTFFYILAAVIMVIAIGVIFLNLTGSLSNKNNVPDTPPDPAQQSIMHTLGCNSESECRKVCSSPSRNETLCSKLF